MNRSNLVGKLPFALAMLAGAGACSGTPDEMETGAASDQLQSEVSALRKRDPDSCDRVDSLKPVLKCVERVSHHSYVAHFGYYNGSSHAITAPVGEHNRFFPPPKDRGQPTDFVPGFLDDVVQVPFVGLSAWVLGNHFEIATKYSKSCSSSADGGVGTGGVVGTGGNGTGGAAGAGGAGTGGASTGGASTGGASTGGASTGGRGTGGASTGGASTGGASTGGASTGGASTGGASTGGASTGGRGTGGASTGGASTGGASTGGAGANCVPTHCAGGVCDSCTVENCVPATDGCDAITDPADKALCEAAYACFVTPTFACVTQGDPLKCWCGTNPTTCVTSNADPTKANGPCLNAVIAAARLTPATYDAATIKQRFVDPSFPLGRAVNLTSCRGSFCNAECSVP